MLACWKLVGFQKSIFVPSVISVSVVFYQNQISAICVSLPSDQFLIRKSFNYHKESNLKQSESKSARVRRKARRRTPTPAHRARDPRNSRSSIRSTEAVKPTSRTRQPQAPVCSKACQNCHSSHKSHPCGAPPIQTMPKTMPTAPVEVAATE